jgi:methylenetetrahydrofolate reductase (NADPH)
LKAKVDAGADYICTQLFFDNRDFHDFRERCELAHIRAPIIAGIMPITSVAGMRRMAELAGGARFPAPLLRAVQRASDDPADVERVGVEWATAQCRDLLDADVRGIHFYTLNQSKATLAVYDNLCEWRPQPFSSASGNRPAANEKGPGQAPELI